jgi:hypothetical protein
VFVLKNEMLVARVCFANMPRLQEQQGWHMQCLEQTTTSSSSIKRCTDVVVQWIGM